MFITLLSTFQHARLQKGSFLRLSLLQACRSFLWQKQMQELELGQAFLVAFGAFLTYFSPNSERQQEHLITSGQALKQDPISKFF